MTARLLLLVLWCWCLLTACGNTEKQVAMGGEMEVIAEGIMAEALEYEAVVCLVTVRSVEVNLAGTRSARFQATVDVEESLHGECGDVLELAGHARNDQAPVQKGSRYVIAATPSAGVAPALQLEGQAEVVAVDASEAVDIHRALIRRLVGQ